jgi:hypothetical protein
MPIQDTFSYSARWDSVGLDCSTCKYFSGPGSWPDSGKESKCLRHRVSLEVELGENGYKQWEWFCVDYLDNGGFPESVRHFNEIRNTLKAGILYRLYGRDGFLSEFSIQDLKKR